MKIVFIGPTAAGSTTADRVEAIKELGHQVATIDTSEYYAEGSRLMLSIASHTLVGPPVSAMNRGVLAGTRKLLPSRNDLIWFEKARWLWPETIRAVKCHVSAPAIHFTPDPQFTSVQTSSRFFARALRHFDLVVTTKPYEVQNHERRGARRVLLVDQGFAPRRHRPHELSQTEHGHYASDITFVGHREPWYEFVLAHFVQRDFRVKIWGPGWPSLSKRSPLYRSVLGGHLQDQEYSKALSAAKICLGLLSKFAFDTTTSRTFEIPACGSVLLAERTDEHLKLFENGREAFFFKTPTEACEIARALLQDELLRASVAKAGRSRCITDRYDNAARIASILSAAGSLEYRCH